MTTTDSFLARTRKMRSRVPAAVGAGTLCLLTVLQLWFPQFLGDIELRTLNYRYQLANWLGRAPAASDAVVTIEMDDECVKAHGRPPWPRRLQARAIERLTAAGARAIVYDLFFRSPTTPDDDGPFLDAIRKSARTAIGVPVRLVELAAGPLWIEAPGSLLASCIPGEFPAGSQPLRVTQVEPPFAALADARAGFGHIAGEPDPDGVFRRFPLLVSLNGKPMPSLGFVAALRALGAAPEQVKLAPGEVRIASGGSNLSIPVDRQFRLWLNYPGRFSATGAHLSMREVLDGPAERLAAVVRDRVCLLALTCTGSDLGSTPLETQTPRCVVHLATAGTILAGKFLRQAGPAFELAALALATASVVGLAGVTGTVGYGLSLLAAAGLWLAAVFGLFAVSGSILGLVAPLALLAVAGLPLLLWKASAETRFRQDLERTFSRYFSPQLVERIKASPGSISLAGKRKELTILFSDIKSFTTMSETLDPDAVTELLRGYFDRMTEIVFRHGGVVDKFIGDGMLAFFGDPDWTEDHALKAVRAAIDMQREVRRFSDERKAAGLVPIEIRIGINTGWVTVGDLGATRRVEYTVIGRAVNLAQRLESNAPVGGILIGPRTHGLVKDQVTIVRSREVQAKGIDEPVQAHEVAVEA